MALVNEQAVANGKSTIGFLNRIIYPLFGGAGFEPTLDCFHSSFLFGFRRRGAAIFTLPSKFPRDCIEKITLLSLKTFKMGAERSERTNGRP
jgi:hypothetical protein